MLKYFNSEYLAHRISRNIHRSRGKNYHFWRFVLSMLNNKDATDYVASKIAQFLNKQSTMTIQYSISDFWVVGNTVFIYTRRPGILIGKYGSTIDELKNIINNTDNFSKAANLKPQNYHIELIEELNSSVANMIGYQVMFNSNW